MNTTKAIELAMAETIREYAEIGEDVTVRAWQSLESDGSWKENPDRTFPMIDVRCSPPKTDDNESTLAVECAILLGTKTDDDKSHAIIADMYAAVQGVCDNLFSQFRTTTGSTYTVDTEIYDFLTSVVANTSATAFQFGGFTFGDGLAPADDGGINMIGITMVIHYSRSDF
ncbi:MAG: hypothetical protein WC374_06395 [Phycisphaerae bacterium]|jgi:hypothetical protein